MVPLFVFPSSFSAYVPSEEETVSPAHYAAMEPMYTG